jgi:tetratricopeptide (TPR) repeat protein
MKPEIKNINNDLREQKMEEELLQAIQDEHKLAMRETLMSIRNKETKQTKQLSQVEQEVEFKEDEFLNAIKDENKLALRETLMDVHKRKAHQTTHRIGVFTPRRVQAIAASIVVFLMVGASFLFNVDKPTNQELFNQYYTTESSILTVRAGVTDFSPVNEGMKYFEQKEYQKALDAFKLEPDNMIVKLYSGFSYMELNKFDDAIKEFEDIVVQHDNLFIDQAEWNLALCYLATNESDKARKILTNITNSNTIYNIRAQNLLEEMGNN